MTTKLTDLCRIAYKYGADKCPQIKHSDTPFYFELFNKRRNKIKKVLELGIGKFRGMDKNDTVYDPGLNRIYHKGASLKMWRDFFPNAQIFGADNYPEALFKDERIDTFSCNERKIDDLHKLIENTGSDLDIVIDDASHRVDDQILTAKTLLPLLNKYTIYIIEDVTHSKKIAKALREYKSFVPDIPRYWKGGMLMVITK